MEKAQDPNPKQTQEAKPHVWDCDSALYDSFELKSFKRQLDSAIATRCMSMSRLPETSRSDPPTSKRSSKISRSLQKLLRSIFRSKPACDMPQPSEKGFYVLYQESSKVGAEKSVDSVLEFDSMLRRSASERFGISCA